jgi:hypothetical protein
MTTPDERARGGERRTAHRAPTVLLLSLVASLGSGCSDDAASDASSSATAASGASGGQGASGGGSAQGAAGGGGASTGGAPASGGGGAPIAGISRVFSDGFEDGTTAKWSDGGSPCPVVSVAPDGGGPAEGDRMLQCNWDGTVAWNDPAATLGLELASWPYDREFLLRFRIRNDQDLDHAPGAKWMRLGFGGPEEIDVGAFNESWPAAGLWFYPLGPGQFPVYWGNAPESTVGDNEWHRLAIFSKNDDSGNDGVLRVWVDGTLIYEIANGACFRKGNFPESEPCQADTHARGATRWPFSLMSNWSTSAPDWAHDADNHVLWDDIEIYSDATDGSPVCSGTLASGDAEACE